MSGLFLRSAPRVDIILSVQSARTIMFVLEDQESLPIDYTGSTFELKVSARDSNREPTGSSLLTLATDAGIVGDVSVGELQPTFPLPGDDGGLAAGAYVFQVRRLEDDDPVESIMVGMIDVVAGIS